MADDLDVEIVDLIKEVLKESTPDNIVKFKKKKNEKENEQPKPTYVTAQGLLEDMTRECVQGFIVAGIKANGEVYSVTSSLTDLEYIYLLERLRHDHFIEVKIRELEERDS